MHRTKKRKTAPKHKKHLTRRLTNGKMHAGFGLA